MVTVLALVGALVAPLRAELKYTMTIQARPSSVASPTPPSPLMAMIGSLVVSTMAPGGKLDMTVIVGDQGTRVDYAQAYTIVPAGGTTLVHPDGSMVVIDPAHRTYWKMAKPDLSALGAGAGPAMKVTRSADVSTVAGVRAERSTFQIRMPLPVPAGAPVPEGLPTEFVLDGEAWLAPQFKNYAKMASGLLGGSLLGLDVMAADGLLVRSILRGELLGGQEIETTVTTIGEVAVPAETFEIPAGFTEVPPPSGLGAIGGAAK
jgi:hypothetical protein